MTRLVVCSTKIIQVLKASEKSDSFYNAKTCNFSTGPLLEGLTHTGPKSMNFIRTLNRRNFYLWCFTSTMKVVNKCKISAQYVM